MDDRASRCTILHLDMDAFFAAVEALDHPELRGRPIAVGGDGPRGAVASCSYEARAQGVRSAMATAQARRRCPDLVVVRPRHDRYAQVSADLHRLLLEVTPVMEPIGLDEAFLDVSGARRLLGSPIAIAQELRRQVDRRLRLSCAVGVARTKSLAKLASRRAKACAPADRGPDEGVFVVLPGDEGGFLAPLAVSELWGVGPSTAQRLAGVGIKTVGDLARMPVVDLCRLLGTSAGRQLARLASGLDDSVVQPDRPVRSIGREMTFDRDQFDPVTLAGYLSDLAGTVGYRLAEAGLAGRTVTVKIRYPDRRTISRALTLHPPASGPRSVQMAAQSLLDAIETTGGVRLLGVAASGLVGIAAVTEQLTLGGSAQWWSTSGADDRRCAGPAPYRAPEPGKASSGGATGPLASRPSGRTADPDVAARVARWRQLDHVLGEVSRRFGRFAVVPAVGIRDHRIGAAELEAPEPGNGDH